MTPASQVVVPAADRFERARVDKFEARRAELADATLATLGELGFARTSLREIAQKTDFSHGVLHYYFRDKIELITFCVRRYKEHCVTRYDESAAESPVAPALAQAFADALVGTMLEDTAMHRLWYDLRVQAMFEEGLLSTVIDLDRQLEGMIWRVVSRHAELAGSEVAMTPAGAYAVFDGVFENALHRHLAGDTTSPHRLRRDAVFVLERLIAP